jgi:rhodanese-related sulfurtransferase
MLGLFSVIFYHGIVRFYKARDWLSKRGAVLVDVDTRGEFACAHPRVAVNIPLESLARRAHEIGGHEKPIVVFAHSWWRGARAASELRGIGFWEVLNGAGLLTRERLSKACAAAAKIRENEKQPELAPELAPES